MKNYIEVELFPYRVKAASDDGEILVTTGEIDTDFATSEDWAFEGIRATTANSFEELTVEEKDKLLTMVIEAANRRVKQMSRGYLLAEYFECFLGEVELHLHTQTGSRLAYEKYRIHVEVSKTEGVEHIEKVE